MSEELDPGGSLLSYLGVMIMGVIGLGLVFVVLGAPLEKALSNLTTISEVQTGSHAVERHGDSAEAVRICLSKSGPSMVWTNPTTKRTSLVCQLPDGKYGMQIVERFGDKLEEVTSFVKDKMTDPSQVERYLRNSGYQPGDLLNVTK
jgi:putative hemolysin